MPSKASTTMPKIKIEVPKLDADARAQLEYALGFYQII